MKITRPTLVLDKEKCIRNIGNMVKKVESLNIDFRPHFKTHQSAEIGEWFRSFGVQKITVSSIRMAQYFAAHGWSDITVAFPVNILEIDDINQLAGKIHLNLVIENKEALSFLEKSVRCPLGIFLKIDTGYHRTGIAANKTHLTDLLLSRLKQSDLLHFQGFLSHNGQTYHTKSYHEIFNFHFDALLKMRNLKNRYKKDWLNLKVSLGDTPTATICTNFGGVDELRPGNFVFYDLMQLKLGVCKLKDIAVRLFCPVVAIHASRNEVVIYGGAIHLSKEWITNVDGKPLYGRIIVRHEGQEILLDEKNYVSSLSQEHGILKIQHQERHHFKVGDLIEILPVHSCLTANLTGEYMTTEGEIIPMIR